MILNTHQTHPFVRPFVVQEEKEEEPTQFFKFQGKEKDKKLQQQEVQERKLNERRG